MRTVCFKIPETLLKTIDEMVEKLGYTNRSDLIRDALRALVRERARELAVQANGRSQESKREGRTENEKPRKRTVVVEGVELIE